MVVELDQADPVSRLELAGEFFRRPSKIVKIGGCSWLSSKTRKSSRFKSFTSRPLESRTVTGSIISLVLTRMTSPGETSCTDFFGFRRGTGGGSPSACTLEGVGVG